MSDFNEKLKAFLHDPIDKCFDIPTHIQRAKKYAEIIGVSSVENMKGPDEIASCMERSFLPKPEKFDKKKEDLYQEFNEIRHPLSEEKKNPEKWDKSEIFKKAESIFEKLANILPRNDKEKFLYLWRNLVDKMFEEFKGLSIGKFIPILPADTRIPDHSIWEHLKIASAIKAFENFQNNSLFLFSIGPVQSFISQARKTQDLFMGSFILSFLTFKAIEVVVDKYGPMNVIYPDLYGQPLMDYFLEKKGIKVERTFSSSIDQPTIPNRFVAIIPRTETKEIEDLAKEIKETVENTWKEMVEDVLDAFELKNDSDVKRVFEQQIKIFPEIYWVAIPLKIDSKDVEINDFKEFFKKDEIEKWEKLKSFLNENAEFPPNIGFIYQLAYSALEKSIGARKNLRDFNQTEEYGKKCHLCGERQGIIKAGMGNLKVGKYISSKENLCVICFTKRALDKYLEKEFGDKFKDFSFPSTAEIACSDFKERVLEDEDAQNKFKKYVNTFKDLVGEKAKVSFIPKLKKDYSEIENLDGEWFFEENLREKEFEDQFGIKISQEQIDKLKKSLKAIKDKDDRPTPYYAIIMLDGDFMGQWLNGERLPLLENAYNSEIWNKLPGEFKETLRDLTTDKKILTPAIHASISHALRNYSLEIVREIVEEKHLGKLVYSGGDDVLLFVNLKDLFDVMRKLRAAFSGNIKIANGQIEVDWGNNEGFVEKDGRYLLTMGPRASASMGVVIVHYKTPFKIVIEKVKELEKKAKNLEGKDAFAIALMKHSGQIREFACKWRENGEDTLEKMKEVSDYFNKERKPRLSGTFPYKLHDALNKIIDQEGRFPLSQGIFDAELKRILLRSIEDAISKEEKEDMINKLSKILPDIFWMSGIGSNLVQFFFFLEIAKFIAKPEE